MIIYSLSLLTNLSLFWTCIYYAIALIASLPQAALSDLFGRKRHLIIALTIILLVNIYLIFISILINPDTEISTTSSIFYLSTICALLGIGGNSIPIARAAIADLKVHHFRTAMGWSTTIIGFGWITAVFLGITLPLTTGLIITAVHQILVISIVANYFSDEEDSKNLTPLTKLPSPIQTVITSYKWFGTMFAVYGGAAAIFAYFLSEIAFYQVYLFKEEGMLTTGTKLTGIVMAFGYAAGVLMQWAADMSDKKSLKTGILTSLVSLMSIVAFNPRETESSLYAIYIESGLNFLFALGAGFSVPSLFSLMASKISTHHAGKLFGAIDLTDTLALGISFLSLFISKFDNISDKPKYLITAIIFTLSLIFYRIFVKRFTSYETTNRNRPPHL